MTASGPILALETSTAVGGVALGDGARLIAETTLHVGAGSSSLLLPAVDELLRLAGITPAELRGVVVGGGPGSFTGLRIAAATAKGLVHSLGLPLWSYSGLLATAAGVWGGGRPVCALFDARRDDVFAACYRFDGEAFETLLAPTALAIGALLERAAAWPAPVTFAGEAALLHRARLQQVEAAFVAPPHLAAPRAAALLWLQQVAPAAGAIADPAHWQPDYVRAAGAERIAAAGRA